MRTQLSALLVALSIFSLVQADDTTYRYSGVVTEVNGEFPEEFDVVSGQRFEIEFVYDLTPSGGDGLSQRYDLLSWSFSVGSLNFTSSAPNSSVSVSFDSDSNSYQLSTSFGNGDQLDSVPSFDPSSEFGPGSSATILPDGFFLTQVVDASNLSSLELPANQPPLSTSSPSLFSSLYFIRYIVIDEFYGPTALYEPISVFAEIDSIPPPPFILGDVNLDGDVNFFDIQRFVDLLATGEFQAEADFNSSGEITFLDIPLFIEALRLAGTD